jgi:photosystem II stability/assembly factor-like uncharacterized protein
MVDESNGWAWAAKTDTTNALLHTHDGGQSWVDVTPRDLPPLNRYGDVFLNDQTAWVPFSDATSQTSGLAHTTDGGASWSVQNGNLAFPGASFHFIDQSNGWAETVDVGAGNAYVRIYETYDGGRTWQVVPLISPRRERSLPEGTLHLCNICGDGFYYDPLRVVITYGDLAGAPGGSVRLAISTDLGKNWRNRQFPLPGAQYKNDLIAPLAPTFFDHDNGVLPVVMQTTGLSVPGSSLAIYSTRDGGLSWAATPVIIDGVQAFPSVDFVTSQDAFLVCGAHLCVTHDGAQNWQTLNASLVFDTNAPSGEHVAQFDFVSAQVGWAVTANADGSPATFWKTSDGGQTWKKLAPSMAE